MKNFICIIERLPTKVGWYNVKTKISDEIVSVPFAMMTNGKFTWVLPDPTIITHWEDENNK